MADLRATFNKIMSVLRSCDLTDEKVSELHADLASIKREIESLSEEHNLNTPRHAAENIVTGSRAASDLLHCMDASHQITYCSEAMHQVIQIADRAAECESPVLISGETGVGKELIAYFIHLRNRRRRSVMVPINCATVTRELFESHLFGHKQGAFTGATRDQLGVIAAASGGTLFLDEIGELLLDLQPKLLRFLQSGEIHTVGKNRPSFVNVRVVASTNRDLEAEVAAGRFRADLFYRLNALAIKVPPLRERPEEIPLLIDYFLNKHSQLMNNRCVQFTQDALDHLMAYDWPGNVRQLSNLVIRMIALAGDKPTDVADLPPEFRRSVPKNNGATALPGNNKSSLPDTTTGPDMTLAESVTLLERVKVCEALASNKGNFAKAARQLGLSTFGLRKKYNRLFPNGSDEAKVVSDKQPE